MLLPTEQDVIAAFVRKCVVRLTDSLPLTQLNEDKLRDLLKTSATQHFFAYYFSQYSRKLITNSARSDTPAFTQLSSLVEFTLDEAKRQCTFSVGSSLLEATEDADTTRENGPTYAMYCLNHLVREHTIWKESRIWKDAFYALKTYEQYRTQQERTPTRSEEDEPSPFAQFHKKIAESDLPYDTRDNKEKFNSTLVTERIVYSMKQLNVENETIQSFINEIAGVDKLDKIHIDYLSEYIT
ncbi:hypothetical protein BLNAU_8994 [Blattamonas nauphoetae]|uniref:SBF1/SBF2 domain-containing protein n=1 Tax=Blattamonas nauphoetae TaxID=2049346 RepID=A0ABQ9XX09_9EUKA|nr:hypothetical protein BLNAU_8994 [Blattamonas nauphoetae]